MENTPAPVTPYEDLLAEFAAHMEQLRQLHATVADHLNNLRDMQSWENRQMFQNIEMNLRRLCGNPLVGISPLGRPATTPSAFPDAPPVRTNPDGSQEYGPYNG